MEIITMTDNQKDSLCLELAKLVTTFKQDENIQCIYFAAYKDLGSVKGNVLKLSLVVNESSEDLTSCNDKYALNECINEFGLQIVVGTSLAARYPNFIPNHPWEKESVNALFNSMILFDRTGDYTKVKQIALYPCYVDSKSIYFYDNKAYIDPLIKPDVLKRMKLLESEGVKTFVKFNSSSNK